MTRDGIACRAARLGGRPDVGQGGRRKPLVRSDEGGAPADRRRCHQFACRTAMTQARHHTRAERRKRDQAKGARPGDAQSGLVASNVYACARVRCFDLCRQRLRVLLSRGVIATRRPQRLASRPAFT